MKKYLLLITSIWLLRLFIQNLSFIPAEAVTNTNSTCSGQPSDFNCFAVWKSEFTRLTTGKITDFNQDGHVDLMDFELWRRIQYSGLLTPPPNTQSTQPFSSPTSPAGIGPTLTMTPPVTSCLSQSGPLISITGNQTIRYDTRGNPLAAYSKINAQTAVWTANWPVQDSFNYPILLAGGPNMCFTNGIIQGSYPDQIGADASTTWEYMHGTTALKVYAKNATIENIRIDNYGDGIDFSSNTDNFTIKSVHLSSIRDDCIQNDWLYSGDIEDSLFDGCYSAFSARTYGGQNPAPADGSSNIWTINNSLIRLAATWGVYKNRGLIPGHDGFFKWDNLGISPQLALHNNIFRADQDANNVGLGLPAGKLTSCSNNTMVWLGSGPFPEALPATFNGQPCFTVTTDKSIWDSAVSDWLSRH